MDHPKASGCPFAAQMRAQGAAPDIDSMPASENLSAGSYESSPQLPVPIDTAAVNSADVDSAAVDSAAVDSAAVDSTEELPPGQRTDAEKERKGVELSKRPVLYEVRTYEDVLSSKLLNIIALGYDEYKKGKTRWNTLNLLLDRLNRLMNTGYGFFGRLQDGPEGKPILKVLCYTNIAWTQELKNLVNTVRELEFQLETGGLFAEPFRTGEPLLTNDAYSHPYYKGLPAGHPPLISYAAIPIYVGGVVVGSVNLANRKGGFTPDLLPPLRTFATLLGGVMIMFENRDRQLQGGLAARGMDSTSDWHSEFPDSHEYVKSAIMEASLEQSISDGLVIFDQDLKLITSNKGAAKMLGFDSVEALLRCYPKLTDVMTPLSDDSDPQLILDMSMKMVKGVSLESFLRRNPDMVETEREVHVDMNITCFEHGGRRLFTALFRDIGRETIYRRKDELLAFLSHEIRNPLQAILSGLQVAGEENPSQLMDDMYRAATILHAVINDTIDFVRIGSQRFEANIQPVRLIDVLVLCQRMYCTHQNPQTTTPPPVVHPDLPQTIAVDERRLTQILGNLLSNAFRHTVEGTVSIVAERNSATVGDSAGSLIIKVIDTGCGMSRADQDKLFSLYTSINSPDNFASERSGLGLLLSRELCRALGGELYLHESHEGKGSTFALRVPYWEVEETEDDNDMATFYNPTLGLSASLDALAVEGNGKRAREPEDEATPRQRKVRKVSSKVPSGGGSAVAERRLQGLKVLCVDDNNIVLSTLKRLLFRVKCMCVGASDGQEAVDMILNAGEDFDIVLMDCRMPRMDGYTATSKLRESGYTKPIIAITGNSQESEVTKCHDSGYTDVLIKPVQLNTLTATILRWVPDNQDPSDSVPGNLSASRINSTNSTGSMGDEPTPNMSDV